MIPAVQSFFEILNFWAGLFGAVYTYLHQLYMWLVTVVPLVMSIISVIPGWLLFFAIVVLLYWVLVFVIHPD